jgi:hypothetical protein
MSVVQSPSLVSHFSPLSTQLGLPLEKQKRERE